ncbi:hypothetical protein GQR58_004880 [Nymphon striatum]|nr:hypothetical protein GQR58_027882 [Nymphon striatum]KAG1701307.1 hypothetical protein GQR58_004880 [Nymphon striatum]
MLPLNSQRTVPTSATVVKLSIGRKQTNLQRQNSHLRTDNCNLCATCESGSPSQIFPMLKIISVVKIHAHKIKKFIQLFEHKKQCWVNQPFENTTFKNHKGPNYQFRSQQLSVGWKHRWLIGIRSLWAELAQAKISFDSSALSSFMLKVLLAKCLAGAYFAKEMVLNTVNKLHELLAIMTYQLSTRSMNRIIKKKISSSTNLLKTFVIKIISSFI